MTSILRMATAAESTKIILDMDGAVDDYLALSILLEMPNAELVGIIATDGLSTPEGSVQGCESFFKKCQRIVPFIGMGARKPQQGINRYPRAWREQAEGLFNPPKNSYSTSNKLQVGTSGAHCLHTAQEIFRNLPKSKTILIVTGPLTTVAQLLKSEPALIKKLDQIVIMGGALRRSGNVEASYPALKFPYAEWNIFIDPEAARFVFSKTLPIFLVPIDVTQQFPITQDFLKKMMTARLNRRGQLFRDLLLTQKQGISEGWYELWDPMTVFAALRPGLFQWETAGVSVLLEGNERGRTVWSEKSPKIQVATRVDQKRLDRELWQLLAAD